MDPRRAPPRDPGDRKRPHNEPSPDTATRKVARSTSAGAGSTASDSTRTHPVTRDPRVTSVTQRNASLNQSTGIDAAMTSPSVQGGAQQTRRPDDTSDVPPSDLPSVLAMLNDFASCIVAVARHESARDAAKANYLQAQKDFETSKSNGYQLAQQHHATSMTTAMKVLREEQSKLTGKEIAQKQINIKLAGVIVKGITAEAASNDKSSRINALEAKLETHENDQKSLRDDYRRLESENNSVKEKMQLINSRQRALETEQRESTETIKRLNKIAGQVSSFQSKIDSVDVFARKLNEESLKPLQTQVSLLSQNGPGSEEATRINSELQLKILKWGQSVEGLKQQVTNVDFKSDIAQTTQKLASLEQEIQNLALENSAAVDRIASEQTSYRNDLDKLDEKLEESRNSLSSTILEPSNRSQEMVEKLSSNDARLTQIDNRLASLVAEIDERNKAFEVELQEIDGDSFSKMKSLNSKFDDLRTAITAQQDEFKQIATNITEFKSQLSFLSSNMASKKDLANNDELITGISTRVNQIYERDTNRHVNGNGVAHAQQVVTPPVAWNGSRAPPQQNIEVARVNYDASTNHEFGRLWQKIDHLGHWLMQVQDRCNNLFEENTIARVWNEFSQLGSDVRNLQAAVNSLNGLREQVKTIDQGANAEITLLRKRIDENERYVHEAKTGFIKLDQTIADLQRRFAYVEVDLGALKGHLRL